jgi:hypothetical protein
MTHEETIRALDELIVFLNRINTEKDLPYNLVDNIISQLRGMDVSNTTIRAIANIKIARTGSLPQYCAELLHLEQEKENRNRRSIQSMIEILKVEQERHKQILIEEEKQKAIEEQTKNLELQEKAIAEQKKGNRIMTWTLWASGIATIASVIATVISIIALYK